MIERFDAIVLAGGRGSRLGAPSKPDVLLAGRRLLDIVLGAVASARRTVVVGPVDVGPGVLRVVEDQPHGGPVAGVAAGMAALESHAEWTLLLACDLPGAEPAVAALLAAEPSPDEDGVCLVGDDGRLQWLLGAYRTEALVRRLAQRGDPPLTAMYRLLEPLRLRVVQTDPEVLEDVDTPDDLARWERRKDERP